MGVLLYTAGGSAYLAGITALLESLDGTPWGVLVLALTVAVFFGCLALLGSEEPRSRALMLAEPAERKAMLSQGLEGSRQLSQGLEESRERARLEGVGFPRGSSATVR